VTTQQKDNYKYQGEELDAFALAENWKRYWQCKIKKYLGPTVLEVGAGIGSTTRALYTSEYQRWVALEPDSALIDGLIAQQSVGKFPTPIEFKPGTVDSLPKDDLYHSIIYIDVLEHIETDREEIAKAASHLRPSGYLIVLSPAYQFLFTEFDTAVGHYRRYIAKQLQALTPNSLVVEKTFYLDAVGMMTSLINKFVLHSSQPTASQIKLWDRVIVPVSRNIIDPLLGYRMGRSVICVWRQRY
jgi:2-polyprenyl-3-methyl-5-hydroxy-6-metoxy-1,4-benzoquinol methylase